MITTNRLQDIPEKAARVIFQKVLKEFPDLLYTFILKDKKYDIEFAAIHGHERRNPPLYQSLFKKNLCGFIMIFRR